MITETTVRDMRMSITHLKIAEPDFVVKEGKGEDMVNERLCFPGPWWYAEYLHRRMHL